MPLMTSRLPLWVRALMPLRHSSCKQYISSRIASTTRVTLCFQLCLLYRTLCRHVVEEKNVMSRPYASIFFSPLLPHNILHL
eukprot:13541737-Ditylum_brightwellii.AAC.1